MKQWRSPHDCAPDAASDGRSRALLLAIFFSLAAFVAQIFGAWFTGSLSLLGDTAHVFTDLVSLIMAWMAVTLARRPVTDARSWGYFRLEVLASFVNGILLAAVALKIVWEAVERFQSPVEVPALPLVAVAVAGLALNLFSALVLFRGAREHGHAHAHGCDHAAHHQDRNIRAAMFHVLSDAMGSVAVISGGLFLYATGEPWIDPAIAAMLALTILWLSGKVLLDSGHVLL
ncbi:MAG: cation transporter, partial [Bdellovibrionales bacterium]|nr:cation transporter [Bdellovibrionales bacterium]